MAPPKRPFPWTAPYGIEIRDKRARRGDVIRDPSSLDRLTELNSVNSPLLRLPAEIRMMIFTYVISGKEYLFHGSRSYVTSYTGSFTQMNMGLLLVSRQAHAETALLPYNLGTFCFLFDQNYQLWKQNTESFLKKRSVEQVKAIMSLQVWLDSGNPHSSTTGKTGVYWAKFLGVWELRQKVTRRI